MDFLQYHDLPNNIYTGTQKDLYWECQYMGWTSDTTILVFDHVHRIIKKQPPFHETT